MSTESGKALDDIVAHIFLLLYCMCMCVCMYTCEGLLTHIVSSN